jgi:predicted dehydrogenase/threonine dehydrogenase-like Zn-dependent dehydrogenase
VTSDRMNQVVHATTGDAVEIITTAIPRPGPTEVLVATSISVISPGTERSMTQLAQSSLIEKARARPDLVRQVFEKARSDGMRSTIDSVRTRLNDDILLGYSGAGTIAETDSLVRDLHVGQRVATAGAGFANHANYQVVPQNLVAAIPDGVGFDEAEFATIAAIAMHGFRLAEVGVGSRVLVVGLGLVGQLSCRIALAAGCDVFAVDLRSDAVPIAQAAGATATLDEGEATTRKIAAWSRNRGADAVLITAGAVGDSRIVRAVPPRCRERATVVAVGDIGLDLDRNEFFDRELTLKVARSYGPGRYDPTYESWGVDYPVGYVRWTEGRNLESVLDLMASGRLQVDDLVSHRFDIESAAKAYALLGQAESSSLGILLEYPTDKVKTSTLLRTPDSPPSVPAGRLNVGICGAGLFVRSTVIPSLRAAGVDRLAHIASSSGVTASRLAQREGIARSSAGLDRLIEDDTIDLVVIATPHQSHAEFTIAALEAGKHVYVEKPLAITDTELASVCACLENTDQQLHVGFNRRWSPMVKEAQRVFTSGTPLVVDYQVNAGPLSPGHWYADRREGGRLLGEVCHFIDTATALIDATPTAVTCTGPNSDANDSYMLLIAYENGSAATISYVADAFRAAPKERCEVRGGGHTVTIDNFQRLEIDGKRSKTSAGKGHVESLTEFAEALKTGRPNDVHDSVTTTHVALRALESLHTGTTVVV